MSAYVCCARVWPAGSYRGYDCRKPAKVEHEGNHYCGRHDPVKRREREAAKEAQRQAESAARRAIADARKADEDEQKRRAECFDDLVSALSVVRMSAAWSHLSVDSRDMIIATLEKAQP